MVSIVSGVLTRCRRGDAPLPLALHLEISPMEHNTPASRSEAVPPATTLVVFVIVSALLAFVLWF